MINNVIQFISKEGKMYLFSREENKASFRNDEAMIQKTLKVPENWNIKKSKEGKMYFYLDNYPKISQWNLPVFPTTTNELRAWNSIIYTYDLNKEEIERGKEDDIEDDIDEIIDKAFSDYEIALNTDGELALDFYDKQDICKTYLKLLKE